MSLSTPILTTSSEIDTRVDDCSATAVVMKDDADKAQMMSVFLIMGLPPQVETAPPIRRDGLKIPITGIAVCCPRAASGQAAAAPPSSVMNSRRLRAGMAFLPPRAAGFPHPQPSTEGPAGPWAKPESF